MCIAVVLETNNLCNNGVNFVKKNVLVNFVRFLNLSSRYVMFFDFPLADDSMAAR